MRRVVVGFSGGVTSAWCAGWALRNFPREEVVLLFHDTKEEHPDTYRFLREMSGVLGLSITERSDGRSVTEVFRDEGFLGNGQNAMCSRILKAAQGTKYIAELKAAGHDIVRVFGYSANEPLRISRSRGEGGLDAPLSPGRGAHTETGVRGLGARARCEPSAMYCWAEHANCVGCVKGGRAYWLAVAEHAPEVFEQRAKLEEEFGHSIIRGELRKGETEHPTLRRLIQIGLKRRVGQREAISIGACDCGD